jgi:hypothetical protein
MTITTAQALTKIINGVETAHKEAVAEGEEHECLELFKNANDGSLSGIRKLDEWEIVLCSLMMELALLNGLANTEKVDENFKAIDAGTTLHSTMLVHVSEGNIDLAMNLFEQTKDLVQTYILTAIRMVDHINGRKAAKALEKFIRKGSPERLKKLMAEAEAHGFKS